MPDHLCDSSLSVISTHTDTSTYIVKSAYIVKSKHTDTSNHITKHLYIMRRIMLLLTLFCMSAFFAQAQMWPGIKSGNNPLLPMENQVFLAGITVPMETSWNWESVLCYDDQNVLIQRYTQTFDAQGHALTQLVENQSGKGWVNYMLVTFAYQDGVLISGITAMWNGTAWQDVIKISETYDGQHRVSREVIEKYSGGVWSNNTRRNYSYTATGKMLLMLQEHWKNNAWINEMRNDYVYDINGHRQSVTVQFSDEGGPWENGARLNYTCDVNGNWLEMIMDSYETGSWVVAGRITYTNDTQGNILAEMYASKVGSSWVNELRKAYTCDSYGNILTGKNEAFVGVSWVPEETSSYIYKKQEYLLLLSDPLYRYEATYKVIPLGMEEPMVKSFSVYPNPADDIITFQVPDNGDRLLEVRMYDVHGREVTSVGAMGSSGAMGPSGNRGSGNYTIDTGALANGLYFISISNEGQTTTQKVVVNH